MRAFGSVLLPSHGSTRDHSKSIILGVKYILDLYKPVLTSIFIRVGDFVNKLVAK